MRYVGVIPSAFDWQGPYLNAVDVKEAARRDISYIGRKWAPFCDTKARGGG